MMWHIQKEAGFSRQHAHKSGRGCAQTHACLSSAINLVSRNDLTKIVNTITYCDRARPQKNPCQLHFRKTQLTLRRKKGSNTAGGGTVWIKRSLFWTRRAAGIRDQVQQFIHTHTHTRAQGARRSSLSHHFSFFSTSNRASKSNQKPCLPFLSFLSTNTLIITAWQVHWPPSQDNWKNWSSVDTTLHIQNHMSDSKPPSASAALARTENVVWSWMKRRAHKGRPIHVRKSLKSPHMYGKKSIFFWYKWKKIPLKPLFKQQQKKDDWKPEARGVYFVR